MNYNSPLVAYFRGLICLLGLLSFSLPAQALTTANYINFKDGKVYVFPDSCISRIRKTTTTISITVRDGTVYSYSFNDIDSVTREPPSGLPTITSFKINKKFNYQVINDATGVITDDAIEVKVSGIGKRLTASFALSDNQAKAYAWHQELQSGISRLRYDNQRIITASRPGDLILSRDASGTYAFRPFGRDYTVKVIYLTDIATSVPQIQINTVGGVDISSKEYYVDAEIIIDGMEVFPSMTDSVKVKGRGNSSWSSDPTSKNPYRLKFAKKVKPLGLTKGKNWVLIANRNKGSMLTNAYGMKASSLIGTPAANHIIPVDLYVNGVYKGSYNFTEKVGISNNSVDLDDEEVAALLELDTYFDEPENQKFESDPYRLPVNIKDPEFDEDDTSLTLDIIQQRFNSFAAAVATGRNLDDHVDIDYLARYLMVTDLIFNRELFYPKSVYCYNENILDNNSKFIFGPMWDLDWAFGYTGDKYTYFNNSVTQDFYAITAHMTQNPFFSALRYDRRVVRKLYELWQDFMENSLDELCEFCEDYYLYAKPSLERNCAVLGDPIDYAAQSVSAANWIRQRANYLYGIIEQEQTMPGDFNYDGEINVFDVTLFIDYLIGCYQGTCSEAEFDMDHDGAASISDLTVLLDIVLGLV